MDRAVSLPRSWPRSWPHKLAACALALCLGAGALLFGQGLYIHAKAALAQVLLQKAWAETLATGTPTKPWPWADTWPVARISAPRLGDGAIVLSGGSGEALAFGPGHLTGTPPPGPHGTTVFAAHRDTHFAFLQHLKTGDRLDVTGADGVRRSYRVSHTRIVDAAASGIDPAEGGGRLALVTCYPFGAVAQGRQRYVVFAKQAL